jgi:kumamolisin
MLMFRNQFARIAAIFVAGSLLSARADVLTDSVRPVEQAPAGPLNPHKPYVTRMALKAEETAAPLVFEVALKMRNFAELQARIGRGERISGAEMAARYEPLASDYEAVAAWVRSQGFVITRRDSHHMVVFARGKVSQIQGALHVSFARVTLEGQEYTSAITAPTLPAALSPALLGINGLQPHIRAHKHLIKRQDVPNAEGGGASYFPKEIAAAYQATALYNSKITGSGEAIAIVIDTFPSLSDVEAFWQDGGIAQSTSNLQFIQAVPGELPKPSGEETLDVEWSSSIAPSARVRVYATTDLESSDLDTAYEQIYEDVTNHPDLGIHQMSMSYGEGETYTTNSQMQTDDQFFAELASAGVTVFASSGDDGATPGSQGTGDETGPVQVENPASDPNVTGVGGTTLVLDSTNAVSSEVVWNENGGAGGGGVSDYFKRPSWQTGTGVGTGTFREVPDVACSADPDYGAEIVLQGSEQTVGGTSWASPTWAAFCALINQARADAGEKSIGLLGPVIYPLLNSPNYPANYLANFRDITSGNNATRRSGGDYDATTGYDRCTGLGTPFAQPLATLLAGSSALVGVQMPASVQSVEPGQNATFTVTVSGTTATYQWQRMPIGTTTWTSLSDDNVYTGTTGPTLTINEATPTMSGDEFQCLVNIGSSTVTTSPPSVLVVAVPLSISTIAGKAGVTGLANGQGTAAEFNYPSGIAIDGSGDLYIADYSNNVIREIAPDGTVSTPYGSASGHAGSSNGAGNAALFKTPNSVAADSDNNLYVADTGNNIIRKISGGTVSTLAGTDDAFDSPEGITVDGSGNVYVADTGNNTIREITPGGVVSVLAGQTGVSGFADGDATSEALFNGPSGVAVDSAGNVYVADFGNAVIREISSGTVTTIAGQAGQAGYLDGLSGKALFNAPLGVAVDSLGDVYIADALVPSIGTTAAGNNVLRELSPEGVVSTVAGQVSTTGTADGIGSAAEFYSLQAVAVSSSGQVYLADTYNQTIRLGGVAATRIIELSGSLAFGGLPVNQMAASTLTITNTGNTTLDVTKITYPAGFGGDWASGAIASGSSQDVTVTFSPASAINYGGKIVVSSDATAGTDSIAVSGTGLPAPSAPTVATTSATAISGTAATLNGGVNSDRLATSVYFQYGTSTMYGSVTGTTSIAAGNGSVLFALSAGPLLPQTVYHYQAVASNSIGQNFGADKTFTTLAAPAIGASPAVYLGAADVEVSETVNPNGLNTTVYFEYGTSTSYGSQSSLESIGSGHAAVNVNALFPGLTPNTPYYYRIVTMSAAGTYYGPAETFNTLGFVTELLVAAGDAAGASGAEYLTFGSPAINDLGNLAFQATLEAGAGGVTAADNSGIWTGTAGGLLSVASTGSLAPGTSAVFSTLANPVYNDNGAVAFVGALKGASAATNTGVWSTSGGSLALVARRGAHAPGYATGVTFSALDALALPDAGGAILLATVNAGSAATDRGIWAGDSTADLQLIVKEGDTYNGQTISNIAFLPTLPYVSGQTRSFDQITGDLVFRASIGGNTGIFEVSGTTVRLVVESGTSAPGVSGGKFAGFGVPALNANGDVAFAGTLGLSAPVSERAGIWADANGGALELVALTGSAAPGTNGTFVTLNDPVYNDNEAVAFRGALKVAAGEATATNAVGVWSNSGGPLALVARQGSQAPGCPAGATFGAFSSLALPDQGGVVLLGTLNTNAAAGVTATNKIGIWAVDTSGNLQLIVREGDVLGGKTITSLSFLPVVSYVTGQSRNINQGTGDLVYEATFSDKSSGIVEVVFP